MDRVEIKEEAKKIIKTNKWNIWKPLLVIAAISFVVSFVVAIIGNICGGDTELIGSICESLVGFVLMPASVGVLAYNLNIVRGKEFSLENLKDYYPAFVKIFILTLLIGIFTFLWSLLFIIPGIIAALSYSMAYYICIDKEDLEAMDTIKESKEMMKGYKMDYFIFKLSFIGWMLLIPFTFGLILIWLIPYMTIADAIFYDRLKEKYESK